jgi:hypothetical protein
MRNPFRTREDPEVKAAYEKAKREASLERARKEGRTAGLTKPQSFFDRVGEFSTKLMKDMGDFEASESLLGYSKPKRKQKRKRRKK